MQVSDLILADYAAGDGKGKFTLVGAGFNQLMADKIPYVHHSMFLLVRLKVTLQDIGSNKVMIRLVGDKGVVFKSEGAVKVHDDIQGERYVPMVIHLRDAKFENAGDYNFEVLINNKVSSSQLLRITVSKPK